MIKLETYNEIIIWGASFPPSDTVGDATSHGRAIEKLRDLLVEKDAFSEVIAIVDSNKSLQGKKRLGIEVLDPLTILKHPDALVIINTISFKAIANALDKMGAKNDCAIIPYYFYHGTVDHPYVNEVAYEDVIKNKDKILNLYDLNDKLTKRYLEIILDMRQKCKDDLYEFSYYQETGIGIDYFCDDVLAPKGNVTYVDVGAYDGNSIEPIYRYYGDRLSNVVAFEPDDKSREALGKYLENRGLSERTQIFPYALGDENKEIRFSTAGQMGQIDENGDTILDLKRFDDLNGIDTDGDVMVKMDIEGAEMGALRGMADFIATKKPYLAICVYHKESDLCEIADYIKNICPEYRLYIRGGWHLECWAVPARHFD